MKASIPQPTLPAKSEVASEPFFIGDVTQIWINGIRVAEEEFAPGKVRVTINEHDVTGRFTYAEAFAAVCEEFNRRDALRNGVANPALAAGDEDSDQ